MNHLFFSLKLLPFVSFAFKSFLSSTINLRLPWPRTGDSHLGRPWHHLYPWLCTHSLPTSFPTGLASSKESLVLLFPKTATLALYWNALLPNASESQHASPRVDSGVILTLTQEKAARFALLNRGRGQQRWDGHGDREASLYRRGCRLLVRDARDPGLPSSDLHAVFIPTNLCDWCRTNQPPGHSSSSASFLLSMTLAVLLSWPRPQTRAYKNTFSSKAQCFLAQH